MIGGKLIKKLALHIGAGQAVKLLLDLDLHQFLELVDAFKAERSGKAVVRLAFNRLLHFANDDIKGRGLACQFLRAIILREGYVDDLAVIGLHANQLVFKSGDQLA